MIGFDEWRARYDDLSFREHQQINSAWAVMYPEQRSFRSDKVAEFLEARQPGSVVEIGGWDGNLAALMLARFDCIETWVNYDITPNVEQVCSDSRYERVVLDDWPWKRDARGDVLIASHVLEHMRADEVARLLTRWDVTSIYADVPVGAGTPSWEHYNGSHILELGAMGLIDLFGRLGYGLQEMDASDGLIAFLDRAKVAA